MQIRRSTSIDDSGEELKDSVDAFFVSFDEFLSFDQRPHVVSSILHVLVIFAASTPEIESVGKTDVRRVHYHIPNL